jgi:peptidoglycan/xylan/chitin deacetylase (PgdA/CDA1 family)
MAAPAASIPQRGIRKAWQAVELGPKDLLFGGRWPASQLWGEVACRGPSEERPGRVALTFDDGPNPVHTRRLAEVLARLAVPATFFVLGKWAAREPGLVRELDAAGHALGNHTHTHATLPMLRAPAVADELARCREAVEAAGAAFARVGDLMLMRPPHGRRRRGTVRAIRAAGYLPVTWTVTCWDWRPEATVDSIAAAGLRAGPGDVIGLHDGRRTEPAVDRSRTVAATERIVRGLTERGLELVTLPELLGRAAPGT